MGSTYRITANCSPLLNTGYLKCSLNISRFKLTVSNEKKSSEKFHSFDKLVAFRQEQAARTIIVQLNKLDDANACKEFCSTFGNINNILHYTTNSHLPNMVLVEYSSKRSTHNILQEINHTNVPECIPIHTAVFQFRKSNNNNNNNNNKSRNHYASNKTFPKYTHFYFKMPAIRSNLKTKKSVSEQIATFCEMIQLTDVDVRLRYFTAHQLLLSFSKLFPTISVLPFGSSAAGLGAMGCDLDLVCTFDRKCSVQLSKRTNRLIPAMKSFSLIDKKEQQEFLRSMAFVMHHFIPGVSSTRTILNARVPIIKFFYSFACFQCDLSSNNLAGFYMAEVLHTFTQMDCRVKPLIFTIRKWAEVTNVTTVASPTSKITNFSLTLLIIFYLQQRTILPPLVLLLKPSNSSSIFSSLSVSAIEKQMNINISNEDSSNLLLSELLLGFFEFYATFDFSAHGICIREGKTRSKLDISPVYIYNPIEPTLNVSRNISLNELTLFIEKTIHAISIMTKSVNDFQLLDLIDEPSHILSLTGDNSRIHQQLKLESLELR